MPSDQSNIDFFDQTANNLELWRLRGLDLHTASDVLRQKSVDSFNSVDWNNIQLGSQETNDCFRYSGVIFQAAMLQGFALECLFKCNWIANGNKVAENGKYKIEAIRRENHDLVEIARAVEFSIDQRETNALSFLSLFAQSLGRYPIAKKWQDQKLAINEHGIPSVGSWTNEDHAVCEGVFDRLVAQIDSLRR